MEPTKARNEALKAARYDPVKALRIARDIEDSWFRCQALAGVAVCTADAKLKLALLEEALTAGELAGEPNRIVSASAWPIKALCESRSSGDKLKREVARLLSTIQREASPVRRADALNLLLGAVLDGPRELFWNVYDAFLSACTSPLAFGKKNSKGESLLVPWASLISQYDADRGRVLLDAIQGPTLRKQAIKAMEEALSGLAKTRISWPNLD